MHRIILAVLLILLAAPAQPAEAPLRVVATFSILSDVVREIGGDKVNVVSLVGPNGDAHTFAPTPREAVALAEAAMLFEIGLGFEPWAEGLYSASRSKARRVVVSRHLVPITIQAGAVEEVDPHVWQDASQMWIIAAIIREELADALPAHRQEIHTRASQYMKELEALDLQIAETISSIPKARRKLVTTHDTFGYYGRRYGLVANTSVLGSVSTETADPSPARLAELVETLRREQVPAIFTENIHGSSLITQIAKEAGVRVAPPLYTDALGEAGSPGDSYLKMMRHNLTVLHESLGQP